MPKYVFAYHGSLGGFPTDEAARNEAMQAWGSWFGQLGSAVIDGGNPIVASKTVRSDGSVIETSGNNVLTGYSLIAADSLDVAVTLAKGCPILSGGGTVEVAEAIDM